MQQVDTDPPSLPVGTEVSAKYKGAFCEAKVSKVVRNIKVKVAYKQGLGSGIVSDDLIKVAPGQLRVGATVEVRHPDRKDLVECTVTKIQDCSQYTVVFDDGDITTLRRTALCLKSGRHFNESETLDQLPLTHPEHFGNPVVGGRRGRRRGQLNDDSSDEEDESDAKEVVNEKEEHIGNVVCVEMETKKKDKEKWFPGLILAPTAQANVRIRVKDEYLVRSFKDGRYYTVPKKETTEFTREAAAKQDGQAVQAALQYLDSGALPPHWDRESLFGLNNSSSEGDGELESDSSDDEPREEKDRFVAQLYKYMDDRGTPLNKVPSIQNRDVDLYRLFRAVQKCGGYNRVTAKNQWKSIAVRLGFTSVTVSVTNLVKQAYKKFLQPYGEFHRKLGCSMLMTPRNSNRSKGRSLVRANSVASPKPIDSSKESLNKPANNTITASSFSSSSSASSSQNIAASSVVTTTANVITVVTPSVTEESENTSESSLDNAKNKRKAVVGKVKGLVEKYEEKSRDDCDVPLSKIRSSAETPRCEEKDKAPSLKDVPAAPTLHIRDSSPPGTSAGSKKDKSQKKQTPQSDDKRNKRKKDDTIEKVDTGDFIVEVGDKLKVYYHEKKVTYEAKVIEISVQRGSPMYLVHYTGWNNRYDEWVPRERIAENITKGSKQKGRMSNASGMEKQKENPSKPPSVSSLNPSGPPNSMVNIIGNTPLSTKLSVSSKRGRGRSDSLPPRSTTPSSVASNSSRTKSPATSGLKRRPIRSMVNTTRRTSANVSDVSLQSESDTDSDEPVRRPTRGSKEIEYKSGSLSGKVANKSINSDTDVDDDEDDTSIIIGTNNNTTKGRNYDLNQIRSELRGLKSPSPSYVRNDESMSKVTQPIKVESVIDVKDVCSSKSKAMVESNTEVVAIKQEVKQDQKDDNGKSSTDMSSETESFCDDDSQSSGKTTTLENMTKKFQQKIKAGKQQTFEKLSCGNPAVERVPKVVEKIIQDSLAEKLQEILKTKPEVKKEEGLEADISDAALCKSDIDKEDSKQKSVQTELIQKNTSNIHHRFESTICSSKYSSLIVEKPVCSNKKIESGCCKKTDISRKGVTDSIESQSKKSIEPLVKELNKGEPSAACSPSSSSSSSSASASSSSRSLPDMSKLDISGGSSTSSIYVMPNKDAKLISIAPKATSPDIYEFKDPEPFEFELRKLQTTSANISSLTTGITSACNVSGISRKSTQKSVISQNLVNEKQQPPPNPMTVLVNRKKKGSPMKEAVVDKSKLLKTEGKLNIMSDGKINKIASTISVVTKSTLDSQTNLMTLNPLSANQQISPCSNSITQKTDTLNNTSFDTLRTSPNFNVNINALNEELAQTVQETTRALTDAFQKPKLSSLQEVTGTLPNLASPKQNDIENLMASSKNQQENVSTLISPLPTAPIKTVIGSPFIETRKDLSNVFELSTSEGFTSLSESKDNKFEFENAKKMLSATSDAFDLEPAKYENRPTSIADKLLKAISQKKEEDKYKIEPKNEKGEDSGFSKDDFAVVKNKAELILGNDCASNEPLNINIDLAGSPMSFGSNLSLEKLPIITGPINKPIPLTSPEPKLGILESITVKNNDLTETIQKLECAIQRKTPVSGLSVTTTPNTFSEDSMDSTDSERRLVIEDVAEDMCDILKSPNDSQHIGETKISILSHKTDVAVSKIVPDNISPHIRADSQISQTPHTSRPQCLSASVPFPTISSPIVVTSANKISPILHVVTDITNEQKGPQFGNQEVQKKDKRKQEGSLSVGIENSADNETRSNENINLRDSYSVKSFETVAPSPLIESSKQHTQRPTDVVPILVPDIPVSVVVASGAVPSVKAAAQAAAEAAVQSPTSKIHTTTNVDHKAPVSKTLLTSNLIVSSEKTLTIDKNLESKINIQDSGVYIDASNDLKITPPSTVTCPSAAGISANSGFYLDMRTELRPEDGVKPIHDTSHTNTDIERFSCKKVEGSLCADELASNFGVDTNNESINLLCEETIPGSPTPAFGGKEEPSGTQLATESTLLLDSNIKVLGVTEPGVLLANMNNSPNDSASHDDSSEDVKKQVDMDNEISPRKRRRPRKQSEMIIISDHHTKRRRQMACMKKIPAGSDSDENSDGTSQRILESRHHFQQQFQLQQPQTSVGIRSCPYNFLVHLDPNLGSDQCIAILLKQIQELRKTYNAIKIDLASIDRRRKKLRRREREKKQQVQNQQLKIS